jgi:hypothetical protein
VQFWLVHKVGWVLLGFCAMVNFVRKCVNLVWFLCGFVVSAWIFCKLAVNWDEFYNHVCVFLHNVFEILSGVWFVVDFCRIGCKMRVA